VPAWILILILCPLLPTLVAAPRASAQAIPRPADERPALEPFEEPARPRLELPPVPEAAERGDALASGLTIEVREVRVEGSSVFSSEELAQQTGPWVGRRLDTAEIGDLVDAVTELYVANGYVSSGAMLPDQDVENGVLRIQVIEARLAQVVVEGNRWYRTRTLQARLHRAVPFPVHVGLLEEQLQLLLQEPDIQRVAGELHPGLRRGEDVLALRIEEEQPFRLRASFANDQPPGIGSVRGSLQVEDLNLLGFGDALQGWFDFTDGLETQEVRYELPFTSLGTALGLRFRHTDSDVVESPFDAADIESETWTAGIGLSQPLICMRGVPHGRVAAQHQLRRRYALLLRAGTRAGPRRRQPAAVHPGLQLALAPRRAGDALDVDLGAGRPRRDGSARQHPRRPLRGLAGPGPVGAPLPGAPVGHAAGAARRPPARQ
jgi:hemolysin activation/secretion protein